MDNVDAILKIENVSYRYNDAELDDYVLRNLNYEFQEGKSMRLKVKVEVEKQHYYH